jgi:tubulin beta
MKEIVNIHVGQCGNQMGYDFWEGVCQEHAIQPDLTCVDPDMAQYNNTYFEELDMGRWAPRAVLVDLEPGVHNSIANLPYGSLFNPDYIYNDQSSAGNVFASGFYSAGSEIIEEVMEGVRKQAEKCEAMEAFQITHSIGGGTGSGLGSLIIHELKREFTDKMINCYSVVPSKSVSDVVLEPYNSILALNHLIESCDSNIIIDNEALYSISQHALKQKDVTFSFINKIVKRVMLESTSSLRFGGFNNAGVRKLLTNLCPFPRMHFLTTTLAPLRNSIDRQYDSFSAKELTRELFSSNNALCMAELSRGKLLTGAAIFRGKIETSAVESALCGVKQKNSGNFVEWIPDSLLSSICHVPNTEFELSAVMLGNTTSIQTIFKRLDDQFEPMFRRKAFLHHYVQQGLDWAEMTEARMNVLDLITEYQQYEVLEQMDECEDEEEFEEDQLMKTSRSAGGASDHHSTHASSTKD